MRMNRAHAIDNKLHLHWKIVLCGETMQGSSEGTELREREQYAVLRSEQEPGIQRRVAGGRHTEADTKTGIRLLPL